MMWERLKTVIPGLALILTTLVTWSASRAQAPTLQEQLAAQYKVAKMGSDTSG